MEIQENHMLSNYGTFRIGGPADFFVEAKDSETVLAALEWALERDLPYFVFGGGSNLLFDDSGFRGLVIRINGGKVWADGELLTADAGVPMPKVVELAGEAGLSGLEAWAGLPGSVGGAVFGNAGCFGVETADVLEHAEIWMPGQGVQKFTSADLNYAYRSSRLRKEKQGIVLRAVFKLSKDVPEMVQARMKETAKIRREKQPPGLNTGSFFKNPVGEYSAGYLIDQCGLKGHQVGGAQISEHHANFFANKGGARAADVMELAELAIESVKDKFDITLEREVIYLAPDGMRTV